MEVNVIRLLISVSGLLSGLIASYVSLQNRALLAEVRQELAELENRIITRINGTYVRKGECALREENPHNRLDVLVGRHEKRKAAGDQPAALSSD